MIFIGTYVCVLVRFVCVRTHVFPCSRLQAFQFWDQFTGLYETWYERHTIEGHSSVAVFNFVLSVTPYILILGYWNNV
jgi:hypothetical protein